MKKLFFNIIMALISPVLLCVAVSAADDVGFLFDESAMVPCASLPGDAAALYREITGQTGAGACGGGVSPVDLNADGTLEYIFFITNGEARLYYVLSIGGARWTVIGQLNEEGIYQFGPGLSGGYYDILTRNSLEDTAWARYTWDGRRYHEAPIDAATAEKRSYYRVTATELRVRGAPSAGADVRLTLPRDACVASSGTVTDSQGGKWVRLDDYTFRGERGARATGMAATAELSPSDECDAAFALLDEIHAAVEKPWRRNFESHCTGGGADVASLTDLTAWLREHTGDPVDVETRFVSSERAAVVYNETKRSQQAVSMFVERVQELFDPGLNVVLRDHAVCLAPGPGAARAAFELLLAPRIGESGAVVFLDDRSDPNRLYSWLFRNTGGEWVLAGLSITAIRASDDAVLFSN